MGIFQGDAIISEIINLMVEDLRNTPWIIEDVLSDFITNPFLSKKYGIKEIQRCQEWFKNNKLPVFLKGRLDPDSLPCITVAMGTSSEDSSVSTLGDLTADYRIYQPEEINLPISWVIPPFTPVSYNTLTGFIQVPAGKDIMPVAHGQAVIEPSTGNGYLIDRTGTELGNDGIFLSAINGVFPTFTFTSCGVIPQYRTYKARTEAAHFRETYNIGCHSNSDIVPALWLSSIAIYGLMRYREGLLEYSGFQISSLSVSDLVKNEGYGADNVWSRYITLSGLVKNTWVKSPQRTIERIILSETTAAPYTGGIKIIGPESLMPDKNGVWEMSGD